MNWTKILFPKDAIGVVGAMFVSACTGVFFATYITMKGNDVNLADKVDPLRVTKSQGRTLLSEQTRRRAYDGLLKHF